MDSRVESQGQLMSVGHYDDRVPVGIKCTHAVYCNILEKPA